MQFSYFVLRRGSPSWQIKVCRWLVRNLTIGINNDSKPFTSLDSLSCESLVSNITDSFSAATCLHWPCIACCVLLAEPMDNAAQSRCKRSAEHHFGDGGRHGLGPNRLIQPPDPQDSQSRRNGLDRFAVGSLLCRCTSLLANACQCHDRTNERSHRCRKSRLHTSSTRENVAVSASQSRLCNWPLRQMASQRTSWPGRTDLCQRRSQSR